MASCQVPDARRSVFSGTRPYFWFGECLIKRCNALYGTFCEAIKIYPIQVSYKRNISTSQAVNYSEDLLATYSLNWIFAKDWSFIGQFTWLHGDESDNGETGDTLMSLAGVRHSFSPKSGISFGYRRTDKFSDQKGEDREYDRNQVTLQFDYDF